MRLAQMVALAALSGIADRVKATTRTPNPLSKEKMASIEEERKIQAQRKREAKANRIKKGMAYHDKGYQP